ncbi:MAG TPA: gas vesicle protein K [Isosphaeraceae bacterium]|jgi:hypothetical protein
MVLQPSAAAAAPRPSDFAGALPPQGRGNRRVELNPDNVKKGLGRLVLTLIELLRELLERQAIRRMDSGSLSPEQVERLGTTFLLLAEQVEMLKGVFELQDEELNLDLGPLGRLL